MKLIYVTTKDKEEALHIGKALVTMELAACVHILPKITSLYIWEGELQENEERVLIVKTTDEVASQTMIEIDKLHSYDIPAILCINVEKANEPFLNWMRDLRR